MKRTPLAETHEALQARIIDFGGWYLPVQYQGIVAEHHAVRESCGIFDTCHMGRVLVTGTAAAEYLSFVLTVNAVSMPVGRCRYGFALNDGAGIIDDLIVYRLASDAFMVVVNSATLDADLEQLKKHLLPNVTINNISANTAKLDIQGPGSQRIVSTALAADLDALGYFHLRQIQFEGQPVTVSRTGYTGEDGFEVYMPADLAAPLWTKALESGAVPSGLGARDTLRLEAGLPLYGHEMTSDITPLEAGFMRYIDLSRDFIGADALRTRSESDPDTKLMPFAIEGRQSARHGNKVLVDGEEAGVVTSGSFGPSVGHCIGFAYIRPELLADRGHFSIDNGRKLLEASVCQAPFYRKTK